MKTIIACLFPVCCILFAIAVESSIAIGVIAIIGLLAYVIVKKHEAQQKAKKWKDKLFK